MSDITTTTDPRPALGTAFRTVEEVISQVRPEHLALPTPCTDMDVAELLSHLAMAAERVGCAGRRVPLAQWPTEGPRLGLDEWVPLWRSLAEAATAAWTDDTLLDEPMALPWGQFEGARVAAVYTNELLVHAWDLAAAIGASVEWDTESIAVARTEMDLQLPDPDRAPMWSAMAAMMPPGVPWDDPFGNAAAVADDASPIEHLVAWSGRDPKWTAS